MARIQRSAPRAWKNYHGTIEREAVVVADIDDTSPARSAPAHFSDYAALIGAALQSAADNGQKLLPIGSGWSFSDILRSDGDILRTSVAHRVFLVAPSDCGPAAPDPRHLVLVGAGTTIHELNAFLEASGLSLRTSGAHDGQTVAGAMGTGTHGSAIGYGAFQNQVRGFHLVTGPGSSVWIEAGPAAILSDSFVGGFAPRRILDPDTFDCALVHLGGLGVVNAVLLEVVDAFGVGVVKRKLVLDGQAIDELAAGQFAAFAARVWDAGGQDPYYVEVTLNPFHPYDGYAGLTAKPALVTLYYDMGPLEAVASATPPPPSEPLNLLAQGVAQKEDLLWGDPWVPEIISFLFKTEPDDGERPVPVSWGHANGPHIPYSVLGYPIPLYNAAYALERSGLRSALDTMLGAFHPAGGPVVFTLRFVSRARGALAFTRFPETAVINVDGYRRGSALTAAARMALALETSGTAFSQHWGKMGAISPARFQRDFGDPADPASKAGRWRALRYTLLEPRIRAVLQSDALKVWGLA